MSNVINFAEVLNARRVAAEITAREAAQAKRVANDKASMAEELGGTIGAAIVAEVTVDLREREAAASTKYVPAYCDPANEVRGSKYEATKGLRLADIAARIRTDIKELGLAKGIKVSVRTRTYSGGGAIDMTITALPEDFKVMSEKGASWQKQFGDAQFPGAWVDMRSDELRALIARLEGVRAAYNRDNSDSMVDYFDTRFYGSVSVDWQLERDRKAIEMEANPGTYWADNCA